MNLNEALKELKNAGFLVEKDNIKSIPAFNCKNIEFPGAWIDNLADLAGEFSGAGYGDDGYGGMKEIYEDACEFNCVKEMNIKMLGLSKVFAKNTNSISDVIVYEVFGYRVWQKIDDEGIYYKVWHVEKV